MDLQILEKNIILDFKPNEDVLENLNYEISQVIIDSDYLSTAREKINSSLVMFDGLDKDTNQNVTFSTNTYIFFIWFSNKRY